MWKSISLKEKLAKKSFQINSKINHKYFYISMSEECLFVEKMEGEN